MTACRALLIAPEFPPCSLAGVHRIRFLSTYLRQYGWEPTVLTVRAEAYERDIDPVMLTLVDPTIQVVRVPAWPIRWTRPFGLGDITLRAWTSLLSAAGRIVRRHRPKVIFTTVLPTYHTLIAARMARRYKVPLILDYQDPWVTIEGATQPIWTKRGLSHRLALALEPRVLRWTSHVTAVSNGTWEQIRTRHPRLPAEHFSTLPIGGDPKDFASFPHSMAADSAIAVVRIAYIGTIWPQVMGTVQAVLNAVRRLKDQSPEVYSRLRFEFIGTQSGSADQIRPQVKPLADEMGIGSAIIESPHRIPYLDALRAMISADVLLVLGSDLPHYSASKLFPYLISGKPVLAIVHQESEVTRFGRASGGVRLIAFNNSNPVSNQTDEITTALTQLVTNPTEAVKPADLKPIRHLFADEISKRFASIFDAVSETGFTGPRW